MQIKTGTVNVTNANNLITSSVDADWSQVVVGCLFAVVGRDGVYMTVESAIFDATLNSGAGGWKVHLNVNYAQATGTGLSYTIARDFTINYNLPLLSSGDVETATIYSRAMQIIDAQIKLASTTGGTPGTETPYSKPGHDFIVGTLLRVDSSGVFQKADSTTEVNAAIVGMVKEIGTGGNPDNFLLQTDGLITGITGITLVVGHIYYLKNTATPVNLTDNTATEIGLKVPTLVALASDSGLFFMGGVSATTDMTAATSLVAGLHGLAPAPPAGAQAKFLRGDATWQFSLPGDGTIKFRHLSQSPAFTTADWASIDPDDSIYNALVNLNTRLTPIEDRQFSFSTEFKITKISNTPDTGASITTYSTFSWKCPVDVTVIKITAVGGGGAGGKANSSLSGSGGGAGEYIEALIVVSPGQEYVINVGSGGEPVTTSSSNNGNNTTFTDITGITLTAKGGTRGKNYDQSPTASAGLGGTGGAVTGTVLVRYAGGNGEFATTPTGSPHNWPGAGGDCANGGTGGRFSKTIESIPTQSSKASRPGLFPGGGGSGAFKSVGLNGGFGADGFLRIEWD